MSKITLEIDYECRDRIILAALKDSVVYLREDKCSNDPRGDKKLIAAMKLVAKFYGGTVD